MDSLKMFHEIIDNAGEYVTGFKQKSGKKVVGVMHPIIPQELIYAAGLHPVRLFPMRKETITKAHESLQTYTSSIFRAIWDQVLKGGFDFLDAVVLPESCETVTYFSRGWQYNRPNDKLFTFSGVRYHKNENGEKLFREQAIKLIGSLETLSGQKVTDSALTEAISLYNENRGLLKEIFALKKAQPPRISGTDFFAVSLASAVLDKKEANALLRKTLEELRIAGEAGDASKKRILLSGPCIVDRKIYDTIETSGALVVADDTNFGLRSFNSMVDPGKEPIAALSQAYMDVPCPFCTSAETRLKLIEELIRDYKVDGAIFAIEKFCEAETMDFPYLEKNIKEKLGKPVLLLETEFLGDMAPIKTRIDAFVELIQ